MATATLHHTPALPRELPARELWHLDQRSQERLRDIGATVMPMHALKRTGMRPLLFNGSVLATVCGVTPALPFWYELNVHRTVIGSHIADVRLFHKSPDLPDLFRATEHDDLDAASAWFEGYDPMADMTVPPAMAMRSTSPADLALATARLQMQVDQLVGHYRALVGQLLHALVPKG